MQGTVRNVGMEVFVRLEYAFLSFFLFRKGEWVCQVVTGPFLDGLPTGYNTYTGKEGEMKGGFDTLR